RRYGVDADHAVDVGVRGKTARETAAEVTGDPGDQDDLPHGRLPPDEGLLAELAALDARLLQQLAVLLLRHPLAALLADRTHENLYPYPAGVPAGGRNDPDSLAVTRPSPKTASRDDRACEVVDEGED